MESPAKPPHFGRGDLSDPTRRPIVEQRRWVRFQDVDAAGTIFFPRVLEYFADAYQELLVQAGLDVPRLLRERTLAVPLAHAEADFLAPLFFGDEVEVGIVLASAGASSLTLGHRIVKTKDGRVASVGQTVHVFVDGTTFRPSAVPEGLRQLLSR